MPSWLRIFTSYGTVLMGCFHDMFKIRSKHWIAFDGLGLQLGSKTDSGRASLETFAQVDGSTCKTLKLYQTDGVERRLTEGVQGW